MFYPYQYLWGDWPWAPHLHRADSRFAHNQWERALLCNDFPHWLGASLESALFTCLILGDFFTLLEPHIYMCDFRHFFPLCWQNHFSIIVFRVKSPSCFGFYIIMLHDFEYQHDIYILSVFTFKWNKVVAYASLKFWTFGTSPQSAYTLIILIMVPYCGLCVTKYIPSGLVFKFPFELGDTYITYIVGLQ